MSTRTGHDSRELRAFYHSREAYEPGNTISGSIDVFLSRNIVLARVQTLDGEPREDNAGDVIAGSGPEQAVASVVDNPNWLINKALNYLTLANYLENRDEILAAKEAEAQALRNVRREELVREFCGDEDAKYEYASETSLRAIDRIIELERNAA